MERKNAVHTLSCMCFGSFWSKIQTWPQIPHDTGRFRNRKKLDLGIRLRSHLHSPRCFCHKDCSYSHILWNRWIKSVLSVICVEPRLRPTVTAGSDHYFHTFVFRPSLLIKISQTKTIFKWKLWSLLVGLWAWPRRSLRTQVFFYFMSLIYLQIHRNLHNHLQTLSFCNTSWPDIVCSGGKYSWHRQRP